MTDIAGTRHEHALLAALLMDNDQHRVVVARTRGAEFPTPALGAVFDGLVSELARGARIDVLTVADRFEAWGARGLGLGDPFMWGEGVWFAADAPIFADQIRDGYLRREGMRIAQDIVGSMRDAANNPALSLSQVEKGVTDLLAGVQNGGLDAKRIGDVMQQVDNYEWVIPHMLERADRLIVTGNEGGGKTTFLRQIALCVAAGLHPFTAKPIEQKRVLVVDAENTERQWRRTSRWILNTILSLGGQPNLTEHLHLATTRRLDITRSSDLAAVHRLVDQHSPDMLMIGPLYRLVPRAITTDDEAAPVLTALDSLRDRGICLVMEAHAGKSTDVEGDRNMAPRGSSALMGWPEFGFGIRPLRTDPNVSALVRWRGDRDERTWPDHMFRGGNLPWTPSAV